MRRYLKLNSKNWKQRISILLKGILLGAFIVYCLFQMYPPKSILHRVVYRNYNVYADYSILDIKERIDRDTVYMDSVVINVN